MQERTQRGFRQTRPKSPITPLVRKGILRIPEAAAYHLRAGHPFLYRDSLLSRFPKETSGDVVELLDEEGRFVGRGIYDSDGGIAVRIFTTDPKELLDSQAFFRRISAAKKYRETFLLNPLKSPLTAYRILHGEGDFLPGMTVDLYDDILLIHLFTGSLLPHMENITQALNEVWKPKAIYLQKRLRSQTGEGVREPAELVLGQQAPIDIEIQEEGLRFFVDVTAPLGTGLFPDLRLGRQHIAQHSEGKRVLNLFSYSGAISVYAAKAAASTVVSVDLSSRAHAKARRNFTLNGLAEEKHEFIAGDVFTVLSRMHDEKITFDIVVVDPPPFSQAHGRTFSVQKDYADLLAQALLVCAPSARLYCCSNASKFSLEEMETAIGTASLLTKRSVRIADQIGLPYDFPIPAGFPEGHYLKFLSCIVS